MSVEKSTDNERELKPVAGGDSVELSAASAKGRKAPELMSASEKRCIDFSIIAMILAITYVTGIFNNLPTLIALSIEESPLRVLFGSAMVAGIAAWMLSLISTRKTAVITYIPIFLFVGFWLSFVWSYMIDAYPSTLKGSAPVLLFVVSLIPGFCVSFHWSNTEKKLCFSDRLEVFGWTVTILNAVALVATLFIVGAFIENFKGGVQAKIDAEAQRFERLNDIFSGCPIVKSQKYCDALKVLTSED